MEWRDTATEVDEGGALDVVGITTVEVDNDTMLIVVIVDAEGGA